MKIKERLLGSQAALIFGESLFSLRKNLKFITIDQDYLKYLHDFCPEVYYKPYIGILVQENGIEYVIPLSSTKERYRTWKKADWQIIISSATKKG